jgi:UTP:GlnB (protein PII) uridylyltransferase
MTGQNCHHYVMILDRADYSIEAGFRRDGNEYDFRFRTALNEAGLLYRITVALYIHGFEIVKAKITTDENQAVFDEFRLKQAEGFSEDFLSEKAVRSFVFDVENLLYKGKSAVDFINENDLHIPGYHEGNGSADLTEMDGFPVIEVRGSYQKTLLLSLFQSFYLMDVNVQEARIWVMPDGQLSTRFMIASDDPRFTNPQFQEQLMEEMRTIVQDKRYKALKI